MLLSASLYMHVTLPNAKIHTFLVGVYFFIIHKKMSLINMITDH